MGVIPNFEAESFGKDLDAKYRKLTPIFHDKIIQTQRKEDAAKALLRYAQEPVGKRAIPKAIAELSKEDTNNQKSNGVRQTAAQSGWEKELYIWNELLLEDHESISTPSNDVAPCKVQYFFEPFEALKSFKCELTWHE